MSAKKIYCEVLEGVTYSDRCLFKLSKVIEGNPTCEECILRQLERLKSTKANVSNVSFISSDIKTSKTSKTSKISRGLRGKAKRGSKPVENTRADKQVYTTQELSQLLGKSERTVQEWAAKGKIAAIRVGIKWRFPGEEIDRLLSKREKGILGVPKLLDREKEPEFQKGDFVPVDQGEPEKEA